MQLSSQFQEASSPAQTSEDLSCPLLPDAHDDTSQQILDLIERDEPIFSVSLPQNRSEDHLAQEIIRHKILSYNRKEKSLEELSRRFIDSFEGQGEVLLELDKVTQQLSVERRRIYDIVNIFESLQVVRKAAKNNYIWRGLKEAVKTVSAIIDTRQPVITHKTKKEKSLENLASRFLQLFVFADDVLSL